MISCFHCGAALNLDTADQHACLHGGARTWRAEWNQLLGTATDREVAAQLGLHHRTVQQHRTAAGIPPFRRWSEAARARCQRCVSASDLRELVRDFLSLHGTGRGLIKRLATGLGVSYEWARRLVAAECAEMRRQLVQSTVASRGASDEVVTELSHRLSMSRARVLALIAETQTKELS